MGNISKSSDSKKKYESFDDIGVFTDPMPKDAPTYNFRAIRDYCRERNIDVSDMTFDEIEQFRSN